MKTFDNDLAHFFMYFTIADYFCQFIHKFVNISGQIPHNCLLPFSTLFEFRVDGQVVSVGTLYLEWNLNIWESSKWLINMEVIIFIKNLITRLRSFFLIILNLL